MKKKLLQAWFGSKLFRLTLAHNFRMSSSSSYKTTSRGDFSDTPNKDILVKAEEFLKDLDGNQIRRKKRLEAEIEEYHLRGYPIPRALSSLSWHHLLTAQSSRDSRLKYLLSLERNTSDCQKQDTDKLSKHNAMCNHHYFEFDEPISDWISRKRDYACHRALVHGLPLVIDMGYSMTLLELSECLSRLAGCYEQNMSHCIPYNLHFTSTSPSTLDQLNRSYHTEDAWFASFHEKECIDVFSSDKLVYLSPQGLPIEDFDSEKTYVIGAYIDMSSRGDQTIARARQLGVEARRLPLVNFQCVYHDLGLNTVMEVLLEAGRSRDWQQAMYKALVCSDVPKSITVKDETGSPARWRRKYEKSSMVLRHRD